MEVEINGHVHNQIPAPNDLLQQLFKAANVTIPEILPKNIAGKAKVATKKKLTFSR